VGLQLNRQRKDGSRIRILLSSAPLYDRSGRVSGTMGVIEDITARTQREEMLRQREEQLNAIIQAAPIAIIQADREERVLLWNPAAERIFGWREDEVLGLPIPYVSPEMREESERHRLSSLAGELHEGVDLVRRRRDGSLVNVRLWSAPLFDADGHVKGMMGLLSDTTQEKELEEQLRQSQKMEAVGQLAGGIAHDFNNLLTAIIGYSDLLIDNGPQAPERTEEAAHEIRKAATRAADLTRQILAFSRRQALQPQVLQVNEVVREMESLLRRTLGENIDLRVSLAHTPPVKVDPGQLQQVLLNLAVNARDAMPTGGTLTITTATCDSPPPDAPLDAPAADGRWVRLSCSDSGTGMPDEVRHRAFEPFFTTKPTGEGTGLGLATVYGIVRQSDGHVALTSELGRGTSFHIYLPCVEGNPPLPKPGAAKGQERPDHSGARILLVEDEPAVRSLLQRVLAHEGYTVQAAGTADEALGILEDSTEQPHLLVTDLMLPGGMSGHVLGRIVLEQCPGLPVLYISGYPLGSVSDGERVDESAFFLEKPFSPHDFADKVEEILGLVW